MTPPFAFPMPLHEKPGWRNAWPWRHGSKFHYIESCGRSLCRKMIYYGGEKMHSDKEHPDNCKLCQRILEVRRNRYFRG